MDVTRKEGEYNLYTFLYTIARTHQDGAYVLIVNHYIFTAYILDGKIVHATLSVDDKCLLQGESVFDFHFKKMKGYLDFYPGLKPNKFTLHETPQALLEKLDSKYPESSVHKNEDIA